MRLLNTTTLQFEDISDSELQAEKNRYAALSHRWGDDNDEVSYNDIILKRDISQNKGYAKIKGFCDQALREGCSYGWVDSCCINQGDRKEVNKSINSMYQWYKSSAICLVYLQDVPSKKMVDSEWFDRGWTLQELIAPKHVSFFDRHWNNIGTKNELIEELSDKTKIPKSVLSGEREPTACSVAQRMSWAAHRITKEIEDRAYSLMGLFDVHMTKEYGIGETAFLELQRAIRETCKDESLFAWTMGPRDGTAYCGIYAPSPLAFADCSGVDKVPGSRGFPEEHGEIFLTTRLLRHVPGMYFALLHCTDRDKRDDRIGILFAKTSDADNEYVRVRDYEDYSRRSFPKASWERSEELTISIPIKPKANPKNIFFGFWLRTLHPPGYAQKEAVILSNVSTPEPEYIGQYSYGQGNTGTVWLRQKNDTTNFKWSETHWIKFGFTKDWKPVLWFANGSQSQRLKGPFERALASQQCDGRSEAVHAVMQEDLLQTCPGELASQLHHEWPEGQVVVEGSDKGLLNFCIYYLNLQISVQLLDYSSPTRALSKGNSRWRPLTGPIKIWTVDISSTTGAGESPRSQLTLYFPSSPPSPPRKYLHPAPSHPRKSQPAEFVYERQYYSCDECVDRSIYTLVCFPCAIVDSLNFLFCNGYREICHGRLFGGRDKIHPLFYCYGEELARRDYQNQRVRAESEADQQYQAELEDHKHALDKWRQLKQLHDQKSQENYDKEKQDYERQKDKWDKNARLRIPRFSYRVAAARQA